MPTLSAALVAALMATAAAATQLPYSPAVSNFRPPPPPTSFECGSKQPDEAELQIMKALFDKETSLQAEDRSEAPASFNVRTYIHVVAASQSELDFFHRHNVIHRQFDAVKRDLGLLNIKFDLTNWTMSLHPAWAQGEQDEEMKRTLRQGGGYSDLNIYILSNLSRHSTVPPVPSGICTMPPRSHSPEALAYDGCLVSGHTIFGGLNVKYGLGRKGVHEVGHWFGLHHPFHHGSCAAGTGVLDMPPQEKPVFDCPQTITTCPGRPPLRSPYNIMDYADDSCSGVLTHGQIQLARSAYVYRQGLDRARREADKEARRRARQQAPRI
ncbi:hypothetical protein XA68_13419 [Ophiocordyceps unilateralis]|uniref:Peptidase M43 pregnancy-associated plasma-A domain-containing protein n=1 Tax=Ophiocordyceps unilateralis TaxID=268505 RepID=A0A2A9PCQ3_OPHUN|nr:hypothetical protein XA68_13419 [Ophiocordyceps unilateralis]